MKQNALDISRKVAPNMGGLPSLEGIDVADAVIPIFEEGGDRITRISFKDRYPLDHWAENVMRGGKDHFILPALKGISNEVTKQVVQNYRTNLVGKILNYKKIYGVAMTDVAGHEDEGLIVNAAFHQSLLTGILDSLPIRGEVPTALFENLNTRFQTTVDFESHIALLYAEISEEGKCRYVAANSHAPILLSAQYGKVLHLQDDHESSLPIGFALSSFSGADETGDGSEIIKPPYEVNEINIAPGDILLLYSDGLSDHLLEDGSKYINKGLEQTLLATREQSAKRICDAIKAEVKKDPREDDISYTLIKKR